MKINSKKLLVPVLLFAFIFMAVQPVSGVVDVNVGIVNIQEIVDAHPAAEELEQEMQEELRNLQEEFQAQVQEMDEEDPELIQQMQQQLQQQAELIQQQKMQEMMELLGPEIDEFKEEEGYDLILTDQAVLSGGEDVTEELIEFVQ